MVGGEEQCPDLLLGWAEARGITDVPRFKATSNDVNSGCSRDSAQCCKKLGYSIHIATFAEAGGRGLAASRPLKQGELILRVPKSALMSKLSAKEDSQLAKAMTLHPTLSSTQVDFHTTLYQLNVAADCQDFCGRDGCRCLAYVNSRSKILSVHLLNEVAKGKSSSWYAYLVGLPRLHHTLSHFAPCAIQALQVEDARWVAQKAATTAVMDWEGSKSFMQDIGLRRRFRSLNAWLWASATVSSRTLHVPWDEAGALCPIGDLFNYAPPGELHFNSEHLDEQVVGDLESAEKNTTWETDEEFSCIGVTIGERLRDGGYEPDFDEYCFYARQAYETGQQVLLCYGQYSNLELLEHYGFSMCQNPNDIVHLSLPDSTEFGLCSDHLPTNSGGAAYIEVNGTPSFSLLAGLRLRTIQPPVRKAKGHLALMGQQISKESDVVVYEWLLRKCELLLTRLPTFLEDDLAMVEMVDSVRGSNQINILSKSLCDGSDSAGNVSISQQITGDDNLRQDRIQRELEDGLRSSIVRPNKIETQEKTGRDNPLLDRWRLALEWRIGYKQILYRCCVLCTKKIKRLINS